MGTQIKDKISINITRQAAGLSRMGFGTSCIIAEIDAALWTTRMRTFSAPADLLTAGMTVAHPVYKAALSLYTQTVKPLTFKVGRKVPGAGTNAKVSVTWADDGAAGMFTLTVSKNGGASETTAPIAYNASVGDIKAALEALSNVAACTVALNTDSTGVTDTLGFNITFNVADAGIPFTVTCTSSVTKTPSGAAVPTVTVVAIGEPVETWAAVYAACAVADNDFYGVMIDSVVAADIEAIAAVVEADTTPRAYFYRTQDANTLVVGGTAGVFYILKGLAYNRSVGTYSTDATHYPEAAIMGYALARNPGSYTLDGAEVIGITPEILSADNLTALKANNGNYIESVAGITQVSSEGHVPSGEYFDVIHFVDWLTVRMAERLFEAKRNATRTAGKIPYTAAGYAINEAQIRAQLIAGVAAGGITPGTIVVNMPHPDDAATADRADRILRLPNVFEAQLAGAIHFVYVTGNLYL